MLNGRFWCAVLLWNLRVYVSKKLPGIAAAAGAQTTLGGAAAKYTVASYVYLHNSAQMWCAAFIRSQVWKGYLLCSSVGTVGTLCGVAVREPWAVLRPPRCPQRSVGEATILTARNSSNQLGVSYAHSVCVCVCEVCLGGKRRKRESWWENSQEKR